MSTDSSPPPPPSTPLPAKGADIDEPRPQRKRGGPGTGTMVITVAALLVLYVLSFGPVVVYYNHLGPKPGMPLSPPWHLPYVRTFYLPLIHVSTQSDAIAHIVGDYIVWCQKSLDPLGPPVPPRPASPSPSAAGTPRPATASAPAAPASAPSSAP